MNAIYLILVIFVTGSISQVPSCVYKFDEFNQDYVCELSISNREGYDGYKHIEGEHILEKSDANVTKITRRGYSYTRNIPSIICNQFPNLRVLDFAFMEINEINKLSIQNCTNVERLDLSWNHDISLELNQFDGMKNLRSISLSFTGLSNLPVGVFNGLKNLNSLNLQASLHTEFNPQLFENFNLSRLLMDRNQITEIAEDAFENMTSLTVLSLAANPFEAVPTKLFHRLTNLTELFIGQTGLKEPNPEMFEPLIKLKFLGLDRNGIEELPAGIFKTLTNLIYLDLHGNHLTILDSISFGIHSNLMHLYLNDNRIKAIDERIFVNPDIELIAMNGNICLDKVLATFSSQEISWDEMILELSVCFDNFKELSNTD